MPIATVARADYEEAPVGSIYADVITFDTTGSYPTGGYPTFAASLEAGIGSGRTILAIMGLETQGYTLQYDAGNDKLMVFVSADGLADVEHAAAALALAGLKILVISK